MNQKRFITIFLTLILALACCSCAPKTETSEQETTEQTTLESETMESETPEQVYEKMQTAMAENPFGKAQLIMDMEMVLDAGELGVQEMSTTITNDITISQDPVSSYTNSTAEIAYGEESVQTTSENYTVVENGELVSQKKVKRVPVDAYLQAQKRFRHLFRPERNEAEIAKIQAIADKNAKKYGIDIE